MNQRIGIGIYLFIQEFGDQPDFKNLAAELMHQTPCRNLEIFFPVETPEGNIDVEYSKREMDAWAEIAVKYDLSFPTAYMNFLFHEGISNDVLKRLKEIFLYAVSVLPETKSFVTNPIPLDWNNSSLKKSDSQLSLQVTSIKTLAAVLKENGQTLSYHFHEPELNYDARELNYTLGNTTPEDLLLTLDTNWCLMGGYDQEKILGKYSERVNNIHLRSSQNRIWGETLESGEEKNDQLVKRMLKQGYQGNFVIEISNTPVTSYKLPIAERLNRSIENLDLWLSL